MGKWKQSRLCNGHSPVVLMLAALAGCSYYSQADGARLRDEVYGLQTEVDALQKRLRTIKNSQEQSGERIARMSSDVADLNTSARRNDADLGVVMEVVRQDVARMKGQVDTLVDRVSSLESETAQSREETELRFQALADETKLRAQANEREREQAADKAQAKDKLLRTPRKAIESARRLVKDSPQEARQLLRALELKRGKRRGWATYAPEVTYLIGETYFAENDFQQAAASFNVIRKKYPQSLKWVPNSILKLGMCLERLDLADDAKLFYQRVEKKYPNHPAAKQARRLLRKMRG
ncbi:MAG: tetratricopeptide repeat protein [Myxococcales bacterium]|nr:tetratricopeptide repeat protein [Myxococcales bacterium]